MAEAVISWYRDKEGAGNTRLVLSNGGFQIVLEEADEVMSLICTHRI